MNPQQLPLCCWAGEDVLQHFLCKGWQCWQCCLRGCGWLEERTRFRHHRPHAWEVAHRQVFGFGNRIWATDSGAVTCNVVMGVT